MNERCKNRNYNCCFYLFLMLFDVGIASALANSNNTSKVAATGAGVAGAATTTNNNNINTTNHYSHPNEINRETNCTSPMPRRKQARPRRRSGECGPHDFSTSKPTTPIPNDDDDEQQQSTINKSTDNDSTVEDVIAAEQRKFNERINAIASSCRTAAIELDTDKVVDCTVAAMEQSLIRNKLNQNENDISDNEMDDDDDDGKETALIKFVQFCFL